MSQATQLAWPLWPSPSLGEPRGGHTFVTARTPVSCGSADYFDLTRSATLTLRFTQRTHGDDAAFEVGVYRFASQGSDYVGYGKFRALLRKVDGRWKIALDADQASDSDAFEAARPLEDVAWE